MNENCEHQWMPFRYGRICGWIPGKDPRGLYTTKERTCELCGVINEERDDLQEFTDFDERRRFKELYDIEALCREWEEREE